MTRAAVAACAEGAVFRPNTKPWTLSERHVPLDELFSVERFESRAVRRLAAPASHGVAVTGPSGGGKSSFVAWVSSSLPESHVALRLPVSALSDPTDTGETLKMSLGVVLDTIEMEAVEREAVHIERAEQRAAARAPTGITGGRIGGGPIPAEVNLEVGSLRQEFVENKLDGDYLSGVNRVVAILASKGVIPVFVFEDTEAIVGPADAEPTRVDGFFEGPVRVFVQEVDAPCLIAIQTRLAEASAPYERLAASMEVVDIPHLGGTARASLARILERRLEIAGIDEGLAEIVADDALDGLVQFYDDVRGDIRKTLAALHDAAEEAAEMGSDRVRAGHVRVGAANWR